MSEKSVTIIGAGLGGLIVGAFLSKEGYRVTIVEKNRTVGGGLQSYRRFGVTFDTGMHIFGGMNPGGNIRRICEYLGIADDFEVVNLDAENTVEVFVNSTGDRYNLSFDADHFVDSFARYFPDQRTNLQRYKAAVDNIMESIDLFNLRSPQHKIADMSSDFLMAADEFIGKYIDDHRLQSLLAILNLLYAGERHISPAYLHSAITMIFLKGACRVAGGYSTFADVLVKLIENNGGEIITGEAVTQIMTDGNKVAGVKMSSGRSINSDFTVSSLPLSTMVGIIDNDSLLSNAYKMAVCSKEPSLSAFIVNIKLKRDCLRYSDSIGFYLEDYDSVWGAYDGNGVNKLMYMTPPTLGQGEYAETLNVIVPMHWDIVSKWENTRVGTRGADYLAFKDEMLDAILDKLSLVIPNIRDCVEAVDTASPLTIRDYTGVINGAMCGNRNDCRDPLSFMPISTRIPNLFVTGQNVNMHGFCGVTLTAVKTAEGILGKNYVINKLNSQS